MKTRCGFVSNSSSSSFILRKSLMSEKELEEFKKTFHKEDEMTYWSGDNQISENDEFIFGNMDHHAKFTRILLRSKFKKYIIWGENW